MKRLTSTLLSLILTLLITHNAYGQLAGSAGPDEDGQRYAMLIRNTNHLNAAIKTVQMLRDDKHQPIADFEVVICGKEVKNLRSHSGLICSAKEHNITLSVCGMSMQKFSVSRSELPAGIDVVPNGLIRLFELQEQGYHTISL